MESPSTIKVIGVGLAGWLACSVIFGYDWSTNNNTPVNGTITSVSDYPQHSRDGVAAAYTTYSDYPAGTPVTGRVLWDPSHEVCVRFDAGGAGCWYLRWHGDREGLHVGQHLGQDMVLCAAHPAPSSEAADEICPAWLDADFEPVTTR